jgi:hypothetical protein
MPVLPPEHARASALAVLRSPTTRRRVTVRRFEQLVGMAVEIGCDEDDVAIAADMRVERVRELAARRRRAG